MQLYLKRWGFSAQKPLTRATQRDPQKIAAWLEQDYPSIAARAKRDKAVIYWSDETGIWGQDTKVHFMPLSCERTANIAFAGSIHSAWTFAKAL
jgi:Winged helix-turn helix